MVVVLNFGSQFAHLIARRIRDLGVKAEILPFNTPIKKIVELEPKGIILSGGPSSVLSKQSPRPKKEIFLMGVPMLGICYGHQIIAQILGGKVHRGEKREFGKETLSINSRSGIFSSMGKKEIVWFSHGDEIIKLPKNFKAIASTKNCKNAAIADVDKKIWGIQFHPEVTHTKNGTIVLKNFLFKICGARRNWKLKSVEKELIHALKAKIGRSHVLVGISGGVDSLVTAIILKKAVPKQIHPMLIDTGLLRGGEVNEVRKELKKLNFKNFRVIQAQNVFLNRLKSISDPEKKREIIGHSFIEVFEKETKEELKKYQIKYLAQGTIYPDRIESAEPTKHADKIKSHHNLTLPTKFGFEIIEPLKELYKDEVRELGLLLGLPKKLLWRHPFPGPGLAVRIVGSITKERIQILQNADLIYIDELHKSGEYNKTWQAFAALFPIKTVGVMGDSRTYEYVISLRAVDSIDGMSADWHKLKPDLLEKISNRIIREVRGVNRVVYDITQKPPATIEYE